MEQPTYEAFVRYLRSALHYIYDPVHLRRSPLVELLGQKEAVDRSAALLRVLTDAIYALKPENSEMPQSAAWRVYDTLNLLYIRQNSRDAVANQLGISERQLRREQRMALEALAQQLWQKYDLDALAERPKSSDAGQTYEIENNSPLGHEIGWIKNLTEDQFGSLGEMFGNVHNLALPLARQWNIPLHFTIKTEIKEAIIAQSVGQNILLMILNAVIPRIEQGQVTITAERVGSNIALVTTCTNFQASQPGKKEEAKGLETASQLAKYYGAAFTLRQQGMDLTIQIEFPQLEQIPILIIDDNADWQAMLVRYAAGSRYRIIGTREPEMARSLAEKIQPAVIFLDVMMPSFDGWQVLSDLRQGQTTHSIPIVLCSVLPLAELSLSLGVNAFLQKPVTQDQFLNLLNQLAEKMPYSFQPSRSGT